MITGAVRERSGTKIMPVTANMHPAPRFSRYRNALSGIGGLGVALLTRPGPNGVGTEIVDPSGNTVYSADQVAANPSLLNIPSPCPSGLMPVWYPGGESICADNSTRTDEGTVAYGQFNYPVMGQCPVDGWCMTGSDPANPSSYVWQGAGSPTSINPSVMHNAAPLPSIYVTPTSPADTLRLQDAAGNTAATAAILSTPVATPKPPTQTPTNPGVNNALVNSQPTGATPVNSGALTNAQNQSGNTDTKIGAGNQTSVSDLINQAESATGMSGTVLALIGAGLVAFMVFKK